MKGLKFRIGTTFILLVGAGMILINIVLTMFWQRDMVRSKIDYLQVAMSIAAASLGEKKADVGQTLQILASHTDAECTCYLPADGQTFNTRGGCDQKAQMRSMAKQAILTGQFQTSQRQTGLHLLPVANRLLIAALPVEGPNIDAGALALSTTLQPLSRQLVSNQKAVFLYIFFNVLILTVLGLLRLVKVVIRPIERLAQIAQTYSDEEGFHLLATTGDDEFRRLSTSINQMLTRIEADKDKLKTTVQSLQDANRQLKDTQQEMVRSEKMAAVGRLAAGLAHEIGNPVGIIQGYLDLIGQEDIPTHEKKEYIKRADQELQRIGELIRNLLDFSRPDRQSARPVSVHHLLSESIDMIKIRSEKEAVVIAESFKADRETVYADPDQLRQVFLNCLLNAFDAVVPLARDERRITVITESEFEATDNGWWIRIKIQDSGPGVSPVDLPKVFDPFFTTKEPGRGTGLGLFVSHTIVENSGGRMTMGPSGDLDSEVTIVLPVVLEENSHARPDEAEKKEASP